MKFRNKKTGKIIEGNEFWIAAAKDGMRTLVQQFKMDELDDWEEHEEPKKDEYYWCIDAVIGGVDKNLISKDCDHCVEVDKFNESIGNYFGSKQEAEEAVRKLKARKRLADNLIDSVLKFEVDKDTKDVHGFYSFTVEPYSQAGIDIGLIFGSEK